MALVLGSFEQAVLVAIMRLQDEAYGRAILKGVEERLQRDVAPGPSPPPLDRREKKGLLASRLGSANRIRAGGARRYYRLKPAGVRALNDARAAVDNIWRGLKWPLAKARSMG